MTIGPLGKIQDESNLAPIKNKRCLVTLSQALYGPTICMDLSPNIGTTPKARGTCNGGKRYGRAITMAHTYASCLEQQASRMFWSLAALNGMTVIGADAGNAFAEADPPEDPLFMSIDNQYQQWWTEHLKKPPSPKVLSFRFNMPFRDTQKARAFGRNISTTSYKRLVSKA